MQAWRQPALVSSLPPAGSRANLLPPTGPLLAPSKLAFAHADCRPASSSCRSRRQMHWRLPCAPQTLRGPAWTRWVGWLWLAAPGGFPSAPLACYDLPEPWGRAGRQSLPLAAAGRQSLTLAAAGRQHTAGASLPAGMLMPHATLHCRSLCRSWTRIRCETSWAGWTPPRWREPPPAVAPCTSSAAPWCRASCSNSTPTR